MASNPYGLSMDAPFSTSLIICSLEVYHGGIYHLKKSCPMVIIYAFQKWSIRIAKEFI
jgi:hypothetical protein